MQIRSSTFQLAGYSYCISLHFIRFLVGEISKIATFLNLPSGGTKRRRYRCENINICSIQNQIYSPCKLMDLEIIGSGIVDLSEICWETTKKFVSDHGHLVTTFTFDFVRDCTRLLSDFVRNKGGPMDKFVGLADCRKIRMDRP